MKSLLKLIFLLPCIMILQNCAMIKENLKAQSDITTRNYVINEIRTIHTGLALLSYQEGQTRLTKEWVGVDTHPTGFLTKREYSDWFYRQEIVYQGSFDGRVAMFFYEHINDIWKPGTWFPIMINAKDAQIFKFRQYMIEILDAKSDELTFRVLSDTETWD